MDYAWSPGLRSFPASRSSRATFVDTHTHLDHVEEAAAEVVEHARQAGVSLIVQSGTDLESSRAAVALAQRFPEVFATVGVHPHESTAASERDLVALRELARDPKVLALGETGLDFYRDYAPHAEQERVFRGQLELAGELDLPLVVHTRAADEASLGLLAEMAVGRNVILHCFSMPDALAEVVERGYYVSFAGNVTYKNAGDLQEAARLVPEELMLVETDAPYLSPEPRRGRPNEPASIVHTYRFLAELRGLSPEELGAKVLANALRAFPRLGTFLRGG